MKRMTAMEKFLFLTLLMAALLIPCGLIWGATVLFRWLGIKGSLVSVVLVGAVICLTVWLIGAWSRRNARLKREWDLDWERRHAEEERHRVAREQWEEKERIERSRIPEWQLDIKCLSKQIDWERKKGITRDNSAMPISFLIRRLDDLDTGGDLNIAELIRLGMTLPATHSGFPLVVNKLRHALNLTRDFARHNPDTWAVDSQISDSIERSLRKLESRARAIGVRLH